MADRKISELTNLTGANLADDDEFALVDTSADETKAITFGEFKTALDTATGFVRITGDTMTGALDVQSTITADGLTVDGVARVQGGSPYLYLDSNSNTGTSRIYFGDADSDIIGSMIYGHTSDDLVITTGASERLSLSNAEAVFNDVGFDVDFRVESDTNANALFVDAGNSRVGINGGSPECALQVYTSDVNNTFLESSNATGTQVFIRNSTVAAGVYTQLGFAPANNIMGGTIKVTSDEDFSSEATRTAHMELQTRHNGSNRTRLYLDENNTVFNEDGRDTDFRVESDSNTHMLFVNAGSNRIIFGGTDTVNGADVEFLLGSGVSESPYVSIRNNATGTLTTDASARLDIGTWTNNGAYPNASNSYTGKLLFLAQATDNAYAAGGIESYLKTAGSRTRANTDSQLRFSVKDQTSTSAVEYFRLSGDEKSVVFNQLSADQDFRVESDSNTHMLFVDAGAEHVNIATSTDLGGVFNVDGQMSLSGVSGGTRRIGLLNETGAYTGTFALQAGGGSSGYGGGIVMYGHSHATKAGDVSVGISANSSGSFNVNTHGTDTGTDLFIVKSDGDIQLSTNTLIQSNSSGGSVTIKGGATNGGGTILLRGGNGDSDIIFKSQASTATPQEVARIGPSEMVVNEGSVDYDFRVESDNAPHALFVDGSAERVCLGNSDGNAAGFSFQNLHLSTNYAWFGHNATNTGEPVLYINRNNNDGSLLKFFQGGTEEGSVSVSGSTVSYNGFSGRHESSGIPTNTEKGTVVSTIDVLDVYPDTQPNPKTGKPEANPKAGQTRDDHAKVEVSNSVGDTCVYGVVSEFDGNGKLIVTSVGIGSVRVTGACAKGDLLESNGDGTAKVQSDDIVRSKTIGKVTIGNSDTGVKLVSCVMYCG